MKTVWDTPEIPRCRRCGKQLADLIGSDDDDGTLAVGWVCESCGWYVAVKQRPWTRAERLRRIAAVNARHGGDGVEVPMVLSTEPFPVGEFDDD